MVTKSEKSAYKKGLVRFFRENEQGNKAIGAGFFVANHYVLTCAHVVTQALGLGTKSQDVPAEAVTDQPLRLGASLFRGEQFLTAKVVPSLWRLNDEDVAVLQVSAATPANVNPLSVKESSNYWGREYHVFGFPEGHPNGVWTQGKFLDEQMKGWVQMEDTKTQGLAIEPGFSGAPVWDEQEKAIVGMTVARDKERKEAKVGFMIPCQNLRRALAAIALFELFPHSESLAPHWRNAYRLLRSEISTEDYPKTLEVAILQVLDMPNRDDPYQPIEQFIGYFALPEWQLDIQVGLVQWLTQRQLDVQALLDAIRQKLPAQPPVPSAPHLLFWVQAEHNSDRYFVQAYLVEDRERYEPQQANQLTAPAECLEQSQDEKVDCTQIEQMLRGCLEQCVERLTSGEGIPNLQVVVFLPLTCLEWEVDRWAADDPDPVFNPDPEPMGSRYTVVLRSAERLSNPKLRKPQRRGLWHSKWQALTNHTSPAHPRLVSGDDETPQTLPQKLLPSEVVGFFLTRSNPALFPVLCGSGAPVAIWLRQDLPNQCQPHFDQLLTGNLASLPTRIRELRNRSDDQCPEAELHLKQHLSLIWEDPKLVPPPPAQAPRLGMTA